MDKLMWGWRKGRLLKVSDLTCKVFDLLNQTGNILIQEFVQRANREKEKEQEKG
jgi:hypothetical protein